MISAILLGVVGLVVFTLGYTLVTVDPLDDWGTRNWKGRAGTSLMAIGFLIAVLGVIGTIIYLTGVAL